MTEYRGEEHVIRLSEAEGLEIFHPEDCGRAEVMEGVWIHSCDIGRHVYEWGTDLHLGGIPQGMYLAQYWAISPGWAGSVAVDADDGIDLNQLEVVNGP